jgi:UDPglucose--hexose-1-phosphate uridylyltransferase
MAIIEFQRSIETAGFYSPLAGMEFAEQTIEVRQDPLTGATAIATSELHTKERMYSGTTVWNHAEELARQAREGCFLCPDRVMQATPRYPEAVAEGGRLRRGGVLVFPNLFPLAAVHAVGVNPDKHFLRTSEFTAEVLEDWLGAAVDFAGRAECAYDRLEHLEVCCNHMLPAGASVVHPHFQVLAGRTPPARIRGVWESSTAFRREHGVGYWRTLVEEETDLGERFIGEAAGCTWLTPFAPTGNREIVAIVPGAARVAGLAGDQVTALAGGLARVLAWYESVGLSAFNFALSGGPLSGIAADHAVLLRVVARSASRPDYRTDDYFLQKLLGGELIFASPEEMAATLRPEFAAG